MAKKQKPTHERETSKGVDQSRRPRTREEQEERKQRILTQHTPSVAQSIADAIVIKDGDMAFVSDRDGTVPMPRGHGFGLYFHDCRFLDGYELRIGGQEPNTLLSATHGSYKAIFQLSNPRIETDDARIREESIGLEWIRLIKDQACSLYDSLVVHNYGVEEARFPIELHFRSEFKDVFDIRGLWPEQPGERLASEVKDGVLTYRYAGADGLYRMLALQFDPAPCRLEDGYARFELKLAPRERQRILVTLTVAETTEAGHRPSAAHHGRDIADVERRLANEQDDWIAKNTGVVSESMLLARIIETSLRDLQAMRSYINGQSYFAAGIPWFATLFGRDSLLTAFQVLAYDGDVAAETLRLLAHFQGEREDHFRDEEPGKILHELRKGELANIGAIPHTPYYGSVDATPLFLILLAEHAHWTGSLALFEELKPAIEKCLDWIDHYGDKNGDGFVDYESSVGNGLVNQGWKDSGDAIVDEHGRLARPPIALAEVQGYVYMAKVGIADIYERSGLPERASQLREQANRLKARFNEAYWMSDERFFVMALQADCKPVRVVSSNPGQALWTGIVDDDKARHLADRLLAPDMFSGWGVRTLSTKARRFNPVGYHLGTVWPHDNAIIAAGLKRYGFDREALTLFEGIFAAASHFQDYHLPEVFAGYDRETYQNPVRYPVACHPQAWAAGSLPFMLQVILGIEADGFNRRLRIKRPQLPEFLDYLELHQITVAGATVDLRFERSRKGVKVKTLRRQGELDVVVEERKEKGDG